MRKKKLQNSVLASLVTAGAMLTSNAALAGGFADGYGTTPAEAIQSARDGAARAVKSRKRGCVGAGKGQPELRYLGKKGDLYHFKAHYNHHNGSCGIKLTVEQHIKNLGL